MAQALPNTPKIRTSDLPLHLSSLIPPAQAQNHTSLPKFHRKPQIHHFPPTWPPGSAKPGLPTTGTINPRGLSHSAAWSLEILSFSLITPGFFLLHHPKGSPSFPGVPCPGPVLQLTHPSKRPPFWDGDGAGPGFPAGETPARDLPPSAAGKGHYKARDVPKTPPRDAAAEQTREIQLCSSSPGTGTFPWSQDLGTGLMKMRASAK